MKKKVIVKIIICLYVALAAFTTFSLLKYNKQHLTEFNNKIIIKLNNNVGKYKKGSLLIINKNNNFSTEDNVFYCQLKKKKCNVKYGNINTIISDDYIINNEVISEKLLIGTDKNVITIPYIAYPMQVLESRWGYLLLIVMPILVGFIYEVYIIIKEIKKTTEEKNAK